MRSRIIGTALLGLIVFGTANPSYGDALAEVVSAFWARVHCVVINVYVEAEGDEAFKDELAQNVASRLLTVWRREMPDRPLARAHTSKLLREAIVKITAGGHAPIGCQDAPPPGKEARWAPELRLAVRAYPTRSAGLYYGSVSSSFKLRFRDRLASSVGCEVNDACVSGPTYKTADGVRPFFADFDADLVPVISPGAGGDPIFMNVRREGIAQVATEEGEKVIKGTAGRYYDAKTKTKGEGR